MKQDLGNGFVDHGAANPFSNHRGTVATINGKGRNVVLVWLHDHRGGYAMLVIDAETGKSDEFPVPFPPGGDCPYASILSSGNRFYTHFNSHFVEFDPAVRAFTFHHSTAPQMAMSMTEDDNGLIWSVTYPDSGVVSFNPKSREFRDYGHVYKQNWMQYQRSVAADDTGWIYFGVGNTASQIVALDPQSGQARPLLMENERHQGSAYVYRDVNGKVYGLPVGGTDEGWYEFHQGEAKKIGKIEQKREKPVITGSQALFHSDFPDGKKLKVCDTVTRTLILEDPKNEAVRELRFDYTSEGNGVMGCAVAPDGTICGGTLFPFRFFSYNPKTSGWTNCASYGQWNTVVRQGDRFFVGGYPGGFLLEWDPSRPWVPTEKGRPDCNPLFLTDCTPVINRPHKLLAHPDGKTIVLAGTPDYGYTGGGLLFWDRQTRTRMLIEHTAILPEHSTMSLVALPGGKLLGGTTTRPGTGGEQKAKEAELYIMDMTTKKIEWHAAIFPNAQEYTDICLGPDGFLYGLADCSVWVSARLTYGKRFFVFDPARLAVLHEADTEAEFGLVGYQQGPRKLLAGPDGRLYVLFSKGIARVDPATYQLALLAESPVPIGAGGDIQDGHIYFAGTSHLYSYSFDFTRS